MLLLVTILLVVVGTISLVFGFVQSELLPIYVSIGCSVLAAVVLLIFSRMSAKSQQVAPAGGPAPLGDRADRPEPTSYSRGLAGAGAASGGESFAPDDDEPPSRYAAQLLDDGDDDVEDDEFPIERYDSRRVGEILPLLAELDLDELDIVREHEEQGKSRATVLARIDQLIDQLEAEDRDEAAHRFDGDGAVAAPPPELDTLDDRDLDLDDEDEDEDDLAPVGRTVPPPPTQAVKVAALPDEDDGYFPIEDYDDLRASEILPLLPELDDDELVMVRDREQETAARSSILRRVEALLPGGDEDAAAPPPQPMPEPAPLVTAVAAGGRTKKAPAKRAPAAKKPAAPTAPVPPMAPAKRAGKAAAPTAPPATKAPAARPAAPRATKKAAAPAPALPVKKVPPTKVPAAKVPAAKRTAAAKAPVAKAPAIKTAAKATKATKVTRKAPKA